MRIRQDKKLSAAAEETPSARATGFVMTGLSDFADWRVTSRKHSNILQLTVFCYITKRTADIKHKVVDRFLYARIIIEVKLKSVGKHLSYPQNCSCFFSSQPRQHNIVQKYENSLGIIES
jgi:hypothetical protein